MFLTSKGIDKLSQLSKFLPATKLAALKRILSAKKTRLAGAANNMRNAAKTIVAGPYDDIAVLGARSIQQTSATQRDSLADQLLGVSTPKEKAGTTISEVPKKNEKKKRA